MPPPGDYRERGRGERAARTALWIALSVAGALVLAYVGVLIVMALAISNSGSNK